MMPERLSCLVLLLTIITCNTTRSNLFIAHQLDKAAYNGDIDSIIKLVEKQLDWIQLYSDSGFTAIHHALRGRHDSLATQSLQLVGQHEVCDFQHLYVCLVRVNLTCIVSLHSI